MAKHPFGVNLYKENNMANGNNNLKGAYDWKRMLSSMFAPKGKMPMSEREQDSNVDAFKNAMFKDALEKLIGAQTESVLSGEKRDEGYGEYEPEDILSILQNVSQLGVQHYNEGGVVNNNNNDEQSSITQVFGEKSKDGDELIAHTLQAIANMQRGGSEDILYKAMTKGGDPRYIHRNISGFPTKSRRDTQGNVLRTEIEQDPTFADTLSYEKGMERVAPQEGLLKRLAKMLGF